MFVGDVPCGLVCRPVLFITVEVNSVMTDDSVDMLGCDPLQQNGVTCEICVG